MNVLDFVIYRARYAAITTGLASLLLLTTLYFFSGVVNASVLPEYFNSFEQLLGLLLLLILTPTVLLTFLIAAQRRSLRYGQELYESGIAPQDPELWLRPVRPHVPLLGAGFGLLYALAANMPFAWLSGFFGLSFQLQSIVIGQMLLWIVVGFVLSYRLHTALAFNSIGKVARLNIFDTRPYEPFARNGVDDVLAVTLLLVLSTVQALDAQFRIENYMVTIMVAIPAAALLFLLPILSVHRRLFHHRDEYLEEMNRQVVAAARDVTPDSISQLESLMQHRDRIHRASTWPIARSVSLRLVFYVIIPPIAWIAAAFVEFGMGSVLNGS